MTPETPDDITARIRMNAAESNRSEASQAMTWIGAGVVLVVLGFLLNQKPMNYLLWGAGGLVAVIGLQRYTKMGTGNTAAQASGMSRTGGALTKV